MHFDLLETVGPNASPLEKTAKRVLRAALDDAEIHPCDEGDDRVAARRLSPELQELLRALTGWSA